MTVVIADSSPPNYLTLIGSVDVLHRLYGTVIVPQQVITELTDPGAPHEVRVWALHLPDWIDVRVAVVNDTALMHLDPGERAAITLAQSEPGALLLIDDAAGRIEASRLDLPTALARLLETNFRVSMELVSALLAEDAERRRRTE